MEKYIEVRKSEAEDDDFDWEEDVFGEMREGFANYRFSSYWNSETGMTYPLILAKIPVKIRGRSLHTCLSENGMNVLIP